MNKEITKAEHVEHPRFVPAADIVEKDGGYHILLDMPGADKNRVTIDLEGKELTVKATALSPEGENEKHFHREFGEGEYVRTFTLSEEVDRNGIEAKLTDGVLSLHLPKAEEALPKRIEIAEE